MGADRVGSLCDELRSQGERMTLARRAVLGVLAASTEHLTAEEVLIAVQATSPVVHRATVYRTLERFTELGITEHMHLGHGPAVYHLVDDPHQHLVCELCGEVTDVPVSLFRAIERRLHKEYGFEMRPLHFAVVGRCAECAATDDDDPS